MSVEDISCKCYAEIENAASQLAVEGEPQPMLDLISQIMQDSFLDGYNYAIDVLNDTLKDFGKGEKYYAR